VIEAKSMVVKVSVQLIRSLLEGIADLDEKIEEAAAVHPDFFIFESLPGAGAVMAPRLLAAFGSQRERYGSADEVQTYTGIAPVMESSGKENRICIRVRPDRSSFLLRRFGENATGAIQALGYHDPKC
jgi:transposase